MKKLLVLSLSCLFLASCLKHDVLKQDATGNFQESEFYTSGSFKSEFAIDISNKVITTSGTPSQPLCKPTFDISFPPSYISKIENEWNGTFKLAITDSKPLSTPIEYTSGNLRELFNVSLSSLSCSQPHYFDVQLILLSQNQNIQATVEKTFEVTP